jgi:hypothetical protein
MKNQLFLNIYNKLKLVTYNWTENIIKTPKINKTINIAEQSCWENVSTRDDG